MTVGTTNREYLSVKITYIILLKPETSVGRCFCGLRPLVLLSFVSQDSGVWSSQWLLSRWSLTRCKIVHWEGSAWENHLAYTCDNLSGLPGLLA